MSPSANIKLSVDENLASTGVPLSKSFKILNPLKIYFDAPVARYASIKCLAVYVEIITINGKNFDP